MTAHSKLFSPSAAARRLACPGSARLEAQFPDKTSIYAAEGSAAHFLAEKCLQQKRPAGDYVGKGLIMDGRSFRFGQPRQAFKIVDLEMTNAVQTYLDYVNGIVAENNAEAMVEQRVQIVDDVFGTADHIAAVPFGPLYVSDYKHGVGVTVSPKENAQAMTYALGAVYASAWDHDEVIISIIQPRTREGEPIKTWETTVPRLYEWRDDVLLPGIEACRKEDAPLHAGDHCRFCKAFGSCPEVNGKAMAVSKAQVGPGGNVTLPPVETLTPEEIARVLKYGPLLVKWLEGVKEHAQDLIEQDQTVPGWKLVAGRSTRQWTEVAEAQLECDLGEDAYVKKLLGITAAEKALKAKGITGVELKEYMESITHKPEGKPTLVPESDKRPALANSAQAAFAEIGK